MATWQLSTGRFESQRYPRTRQAGKGQDIKGILKEPIRTGEYALPWELELALTQNYFASLLAGRVTSRYLSY